MILATSTLLFFLAGACVLDVTLTLAITLSLVGFGLADRSKKWAALFFIGIGIGAAVKGPIAGAVVLLVIAPWVLLRRWACGEWPAQLRSLPWITGAVIALLTVAPFYLIQELRNPGFLHYFIWNENIQRYLIKDYGDEYGSGHRQPFGTSWLMLAIGFFPWSLIMLPTIAIFYRLPALNLIRRWIGENPWALYGLTWAASCPLIFTFAKQYTGTYLVPSIPGCALLVASISESIREKGTWKGSIPGISCRIAVFVLGVVGFTLGIVSLWYGASYEIVTASFLLMALVGSRAVRQVNFTEMLPSIAWVALTTTAVYAVAVLCFSPSLSENRSSRRVLEMAKTLKPAQSQLDIGFAYHFPFSAKFYGSTSQKTEIRTYLIREGELAQAEIDLLIAKGQNVARIMAEEPNRKLLYRLGKWAIFEGNRKDGANE